MIKLFDVRVSSWNSQGDFRDKSTYLNNLLSSYAPNILCVQEEGTPGRTGYAEGETFMIGADEFKCVWSEPDPTAKNERCTVAIMVEKKFQKHVINAGSFSQWVSRPVCYIDLASGVRIATIHAIANSADSVSEVRKAIEWLDENSPGGNWLLTGDFNSSPFVYDLSRNQISPNRESKIQYFGSSSREQKYCNILFDAGVTQGAQGKRCKSLDFAFSGSNHYFTVNRISNTMVTDESANHVSDHNLIQIYLSI